MKACKELSTNSVLQDESYELYIYTWKIWWQVRLLSYDIKLFGHVFYRSWKLTRIQKYLAPKSRAVVLP